MVDKQSDGCLYLGPLPSHRLAKQVIEAVETAVPLRRCTARPQSELRDAPCAPAQLRVAACPCSGQTSPAAYREIADAAARALTTAPAIVLDPLHAKMRRLAESGRFEEAAAVRDRASAFVRAVERQRRLDALLAAGRVEFDVAGGGAIVHSGRLVSCWPQGSPPPALELALWPPPDALVSKEIAAEALVIASWLDRRGAATRLVSCDGEFAWPAARLPRFEPGRARRQGSRAAA